MSLNILDLNDDCIACILRFLPIDTHLSFAKACTRFQNVWLIYQNYIYTRVELGKTCKEGLKQELLLLRQINKHVKHIAINFNRHFAWSGGTFMQAVRILKTMTALERVTLWIKDNEPYTTYERILRTLYHLPNIKGIATYQDTTFVESLYMFDNCESLLAESAVNRNPLLESINNHTKVHIVLLKNASIRPTLEDLVRHTTCTKELTFSMTHPAVDYIPLAELPELCELHIFGDDQNLDYGPLLPLVTVIAKKLSNKLHTLTINAPGLGYTEACQIAQIGTLERLDCHFSDPHCLEVLTALEKLKDLFIELPKTSPIDDIVLNVIKHCQNLNVFRIDIPNLSPTFLDKAHQILEEIRDPTKQKPLILMLGLNCDEADKQRDRYFKVIQQELVNW